MVPSLSSVDYPGLADNSLRRAAQAMSLLPKNTTPQTRTANSSLVATMSRPEVIGSIIGQILADRQTLAEIAWRSYRHPDDFDEIVLIDSSDIRSYRLTLHIRDPLCTADEPADASIHDHRFSFWSAVLVGSLTTEIFTRDASGMPFSEYQHTPRPHGDDGYTSMGLTYLAAEPACGAEPGSAYYLPYHQIHRVLFPDDLVAALVMRGPRQRNYTSVYSNYRPSSSGERVLLAIEEVAEKLMLIRDSLPGR